MALWTFLANYDPEARVWWTMQEELGIGTEAESIEQLAARLEVVVPDVIEECRDSLTEEQQRGPHEIHLIAHYEMQLRAAA